MRTITAIPHFLRRDIIFWLYAYRGDDDTPRRRLLNNSSRRYAASIPALSRHGCHEFHYGRMIIISHELARAAGLHFATSLLLLALSLIEASHNTVSLIRPSAIFGTREGERFSDIISRHFAHYFVAKFLLPQTRSSSLAGTAFKLCEKAESLAIIICLSPPMASAFFSMPLQQRRVAPPLLNAHLSPYQMLDVSQYRHLLPAFHVPVSTEAICASIRSM